MITVTVLSRECETLLRMIGMQQAEDFGLAILRPGNTQFYPCPLFCAPPDTSAREAVLGVLTTERSPWRASVRASFFQFAVQESMTLRIVLRGINASLAVRNESSIHGDTIFLRAPAALTDGRGPLMSTLHWLGCAVVHGRCTPHWKAEDDTHPPPRRDLVAACITCYSCRAQGTLPILGHGSELLLE